MLQRACSVGAIAALMCATAMQASAVGAPTAAPTAEPTAAPTTGPAVANAGAPCVEIEGAARERYLDCLSAQLAARSQADAALHRASMDAVIESVAPASPAAAGVFNQTATHQTLGSAFGHGVRRPETVMAYPQPLQPPARH